MKSGFSVWLGAIVLLCVVSLCLQVVNVFRSGSHDYEYKALNSAQMDLVGFNSVAKEEGLTANEKGEFTFPKEAINKIAKDAMLSRTIQEVEKDGGWEFVAVTTDNYFIFKRVK